MFDESHLTEDGFLDGRLRILQPRDGYRAATDPVFLAAAVPAKQGERVLELGCGAGVASLCVAYRTGALPTGVEVQHPYADLARRNAARNGLPLTVIEADIEALSLAETYDHVFANPPYYAGGTPSADAGRDMALRERMHIGRWIAVMARRVRPGGTITLIFGADRLPNALIGMPPSLGSTVVLPLAARIDRAPKRLILQARKGGRAAFCLLPPVILHAGTAHEGDGVDDTMPLPRSILRHGSGFPPLELAKTGPRKKITEIDR
ncbi:tRNA1(Val) (adenine(37)-N6)-methyltransferase [Falsirhodobacter sp. alg1]|uniref:tRNA1(Val) (adenine(37)-N6)-methyltransferase n=1 Tax=Falsirhodobacter sp. alg1 TaxID=1472418 RepID=UPI0005F0800E|nr:methyltransferase [Falsirhodobacter sp. alg1]